MAPAALKPTAPAPRLTLGGTVTGLTGSGLVLNWNDGFGGLAVTNSGPFTFGNHCRMALPHTSGY